MKHPTQALRSTIQGSARFDVFEAGAVDRYVEAWKHPGSLTGILNYPRALRERTAPDEPARIAPRIRPAPASEERQRPGRKAGAASHF